MQIAYLLHHPLIEREAPRGVDDQHIGKLDARAGQRALGNRDRELPLVAGKEPDAHGLGQALELAYRRRAVDIRADQQHLFAFLFQPARELRGAGGLAAALQAGHQDHGGWLHREVERFVGAAHGALELHLHDTQEGLSGAEAFHDLLPQRPFAHLLHEILDHRQRHIRLEQGLAHFAQRILDVFLVQGRLAGNTAQRFRQAFAEILEHGQDDP